MARRRRLVASGALLAAGAVAAGIWITSGWTDSPDAADTAAAGATGRAGTASTPGAAAPATPDAAFPSGAVPEDELPDVDDVVTDAPAPAPSGGDVGVLVTYAGWDPASSAVEVAGIVDRVVATEGACTVTLTSGDRTVTAGGPATPDVTTTACGSVFVDGAQLAPGTWSAVLSFAAGTTSGASAPVEVQVP
ncbi:hypothetical protein [Trujillonella humicola]|uniref:hypothetical protein n=1 Tax=Trujillonella humicola TaxID=3383699 RepID=UPI00390648BE